MTVRDFLWVNCIAIVMWAGATPCAGADKPALKAHRIAGGEYVVAREMASFYGLGRNLSGSSNRADYRTNFARLALQANRRDISLNGVQHWLSAPVLAARGQLWISATDVLKTIDPVLRQGRSKTQAPVRLVVLDPGHGGTDRGARGLSGAEKQLTLDLARRVRQYLESSGVTVALTRTSDRTVPLEDRIAFARARKADLFLSLHFNSGGSAHGIETFCLPPAGAVSTASPFRGFSRRTSDGSAAGNRYDAGNIWLAHCVQLSLLGATGATDRGVRRARFYVLRNASCPAILVEAGFLTNRAEERKLLNSEYRDRLAKAISDGILTYKASVDKP